MLGLEDGGKNDKVKRRVNENIYSIRATPSLLFCDRGVQMIGDIHLWRSVEYVVCGGEGGSFHVSW